MRSPPCSEDTNRQHIRSACSVLLQRIVCAWVNITRKSENVKYFFDGFSGFGIPAPYTGRGSRHPPVCGWRAWHTRPAAPQDAGGVQTGRVQPCCRRGALPLCGGAAPGAWCRSCHAIRYDLDIRGCVGDRSRSLSGAGPVVWRRNAVCPGSAVRRFRFRSGCSCRGHFSRSVR